MTKDQQDAILLGPIILARIVSRQRQCRHGHRIVLDTTIHDDLNGIREALRLDDPVLGDIIAQAKRSGQPIQWSEERNGSAHADHRPEHDGSAARRRLRARTQG